MKVTKVVVSDDEENDAMDIDREGAAANGAEVSQTNGQGGSKKASEQYQKVGVVNCW